MNLDDLGPLPDAANAEHVQTLAQAIDRLPTSAHPFFAFELIHRDMMRFENPQLNAMIGEARAKDVLIEAVRSMFDMLPQVATELVESSADWCLHGTDSTGEGVGGWS